MLTVGPLKAAGSVIFTIYQYSFWSTGNTSNSANIYTNTQRTLREHADGLYGAYCARLNRMKALADEMGV